MQNRDHTWDLYLHYYKCPNCGFINADRQAYQYRTGGKYQKKLHCRRCSHEFTVYKVCRPSLGPIIGDGQPGEIEWNE